MSCPTLLTKVRAKLATFGARHRGCGFSCPLVVSRAVNVLKGKNSNTSAHTQPTSWDDDSVFDKGKAKDDFRQYDEACDRVKAFYREQHGTHLWRPWKPILLSH